MVARAHSRNVQPDEQDGNSPEYPCDPEQEPPVSVACHDRTDWKPQRAAHAKGRAHERDRRTKPCRWKYIPEQGDSQRDNAEPGALQPTPNDDPNEAWRERGDERSEDQESEQNQDDGPLTNHVTDTPDYWGADRRHQQCHRHD